MIANRLSGRSNTEIRRMKRVRPAIIRLAITAAWIGATAIFFAASPLAADTWDNPSNLKVLPKDISPADLRQTMLGFVQGTGSPCSACHVAKDESDFSTYDYSLDDKETKRKAREMYLLVQDANERFARAFGNSSRQIMKVTCETCHRGQAKPLMLQSVLMDTYRKSGLEEAVDEYRSLKQEHYGGYAYDFAERSLMRLARHLIEAEELDAALRFLDVNLETYPRSWRTYVRRAQVHVAQSKPELARASLMKALEINPDSDWIKEQLAELDAGPDAGS